MVTKEEAERLLRVSGLQPTIEMIGFVISVYELGYAKGYTKANLDAVDKGEMKW